MKRQNFSLPDNVYDWLKHMAAKEGMPVSTYLAYLLRRQMEDSERR